MRPLQGVARRLRRGNRSSELSENASLIMICSLLNRDIDATATGQPQADLAEASILFAFFAVLFDGMPARESACNRCFLDLITIKQVAQIEFRIISNLLFYDACDTDKT